MRSEVKTWICQFLHQLLDERMAKNNFTRRKNSLVYSRKLVDSHQKIDVDLSIHPRDCPNAAAAIYPWLTVSMDSVNALSQELVGGSSELDGPPNMTLKEPVSFTSPGRRGGRWFIYQADSIPTVVLNMGDFLSEWTIPFLDYYCSAEAICDAHARSDTRVVSDRGYGVRIAAAMVLQNGVDDAMDFVDKYFGKLGPRRQYEILFRNLHLLKDK